MVLDRLTTMHGLYGRVYCTAMYVAPILWLGRAAKQCSDHGVPYGEDDVSVRNSMIHMSGPMGHHRLKSYLVKHMLRQRSARALSISLW